MADPVIPPVTDPNAVIPPVTVPDTPKDDPASKATADAEAAAKAAADANKADKDEDTTDEDNKELDTSVWGTTNDEVGDSVLQLLQNSGVTPETAKALLYDAVRAGDPSTIDRDALVEAVGKAKANLILAGVDNFVTKRKTQVQEVLTVLHEEVGGKEQWDTMVVWAKENLTQEEIDDYIAMVDQGGRKARMAAKDMRERYEAAGNTSVKPDGTVVPNKNQPASSTIKPLSRADYYKEITALRKSGSLTEAAAATLWKQRVAGQKQGI